MPWHESFNKLWCFLQDTVPCFEGGLQWKLCKPVFCTEFAKSNEKKKNKQKNCKKDTKVLQKDWMFHWSCSCFNSKHFGKSSVLNTWPTALAEERCFCVLGLQVSKYVCVSTSCFWWFIDHTKGKDPTKSSKTLEKLAARDFSRCG